MIPVWPNPNRMRTLQLLNVLSIQELNRGDFLYKKGDSSQWFYFMLKGKIEIVVDGSAPGEFKFSKNADEFDFFGQKQFTSE